MDGSRHLFVNGEIPPLKLSIQSSLWRLGTNCMVAFACCWDEIEFLAKNVNLLSGDREKLKQTEPHTIPFQE